MMIIKTRWGIIKKLRPIELLVMDCDGTLTTGILPERQFDVKDGYGLTKLKIEKAIISGRVGLQITERAKELNIEYVFTGANDKLIVMQRLAKFLGLSQAQICYIGDDLNDLSCIEWAGVGIAVNDAVSTVKKQASYITKSSGGKGAVREVCDLIERAKEWEQKSN